MIYVYITHEEKKKTSRIAALEMKGLFKFS